MPAFSSSRPSAVDGIQRNCRSSKKLFGNYENGHGNLTSFVRYISRIGPAKKSDFFLPSPDSKKVGLIDRTKCSAGLVSPGLSRDGA
jgi:hypothetical protein